MSLVGLEEGVGVVGAGPRCWRDSGIRSRLLFALQHEEQDTYQKDVVFMVGEPPQIITAHKLILTLSSAYFDKLIRGGGGGFISLPRVDPLMFKRLLKFIYTDEIEHDNFLSFLDFAKTFGFHHLHHICIESWQRTGITVENVVFILALEERRKQWRIGGSGGAAAEEKDTSLRQNCLQFINRNADRVVRLDSFNEIPQQDLASVLQSDDFVLEGGEYSVFLVALRWAKYQCRTGGLVGGETPENIAMVLGEARLAIRYTLIPYPKVLTEVKSSGLISLTEFVQVLKTFIDPTENTLGISTLPRKGGTPLLPGQRHNKEITKLAEDGNSGPKPKRIRTRSSTETNLVRNNLPPRPLSPTQPLPLASPAPTAPLPPAENDLVVSDPSSSNCHDSLTRAPYLKNVTPHVEQLVLQKLIPTTPLTASIPKSVKKQVSTAKNHQNNFTSKCKDFQPQTPKKLLLQPVPEPKSHEPRKTKTVVIDQKNKIWICPSCKKLDDGSPMIGCDGCDDWYHFICVGIIKVPEADTEWFCPRCRIQKENLPVPENKIQTPSPPPPTTPPEAYSPISSISSDSFDAGLLESVHQAENVPSPAEVPSGNVSPISSASGSCLSISAPSVDSIRSPPAAPITKPPISATAKPISSVKVGTSVSSSLTEFRLSDSTLNWTDLIMATKRKHLTLTHILLNNSTLLDFDKTYGKRVALPQLKTFHYSLDRDSGSLQSSSSNPCLPDKTHPYFVNTKGFLFFEKTHHVQNFWVFSKLADLGVDIRVWVKGINLMTISPSEKKIQLSYPPTKVGDLILQYCPWDTTILSLCCATIKYPDQMLTGSLEQINFYNVEMHGMTPIRLVNQCPSLKHISLHEYQESPRENSQILLSSDLRLCRSSLKSLTLTQYNISCPSRKSVSDLLPFSSLESLYLNCCGWNYHFPRYFHKIFPKLKRFGIRWEGKNKSETCALLVDILEGSYVLEYLSISRQRSETVAGDVDESKISNFPTEEEIWMHNFLATRAGPDAENTPVVSGSAEVDIFAQNIVLRYIDEGWVRDGIDDTDQIHFKALKLDHFFDDAEMTKFLSL